MGEPVGPSEDLRASALHLLGGADLGDAVVLELGGADPATAATIGALGATYVGLHRDPDTVAKLLDAGFDGHVLDPATDLGPRLREVLGQRRPATVLCLDLLGLDPVGPLQVLAALAELTAANPDVELVVSAPNVAHVDLARQLLIGQWEPRPALTSDALTVLMAQAGWHESARQDQRHTRTGADHPAFGSHPALARFTAQLRAGPDEFGEVTRFVRRYHRGAPRHSNPHNSRHGNRHGDQRPTGSPAVLDEPPFLSIVLRTQGQRDETLADVLCCLAAQAEQDFEVVLVVHDPDRVAAVTRLVDEFDVTFTGRVRIVGCAGGGRARPANVGLRRATGRYVAFLDDDDLVLAHWVQAFKQGAAGHPGMIVRCWAAEQHRAWSPAGRLALHAPIGPLNPLYATDFDLVRHIRQNETPIHCFAFPRALLDMGFELDESISVCEDWQFLVRAAALCGVHDVRELTAIYNKFSERSSAHLVPAAEWSTMRSMIHVQLDRTPLLLPPGSASALDRMLQRLETTDAELAAYRHVADEALHALTELRRSTSWRASAPLRLLGRSTRRMLGLARRVLGLVGRAVRLVRRLPAQPPDRARPPA